MVRAGSLIVAIALCSGVLLPQISRAQTQPPPERKVVSRVAPVYPDLAKHMHISGVVKIEVVIKSNGNVKSTKVVGGNPVLIDSAVDAVRKWKFEAAPEETTAVVQLTFDPR